jgi:hypothetical protein
MFIGGRLLVTMLRRLRLGFCDYRLFSLRFTQCSSLFSIYMVLFGPVIEELRAIRHDLSLEKKPYRLFSGGSLFSRRNFRPDFSAVEFSLYQLFSNLEHIASSGLFFSLTICTLLHVTCSMIRPRIDNVWQKQLADAGGRLGRHFGILPPLWAFMAV